MLLVAVLVAVGVAVGAGRAEAGRGRFAWLYDTEVLPERMVEIEQWTMEQNGKGAADIDLTTLWWAPVLGITDQIELALPTALVSSASDTAPRTTALARVGLEARWRLMSPDPVESGPTAVLLRLSANRLVAERKAAVVEPGVVVSWACRGLHLGADLGVEVTIREKAAAVAARPGGGITYGVTEELRLGVEAFAVLGLNGDTGPDWIAAGPNLGWTHGRFWLTAAFLVGLQGIDTAPRLNWGVAF